MIKGKWLLSLAQRVAEGSTTVGEAVSFIGRRVRWSDAPLEIEGVRFEQVDRITWGLIALVLVDREYNPSGFEIGSKDTVVDIGAHRGVFLGYAAKRTEGRILAIEPDPDNYRAMQRFIELNGFTNIDGINAAVSSVTGEERLYRSDITSRHTLSAIDQKTGEALKDSVVVAALSLDDALDRFEVVDYLKMDCEGAEYSILTSCSDQVLRKIKSLVAELHGLNIPGQQETIEERLKPFYTDITIEKTSPGLGLLFAR